MDSRRFGEDADQVELLWGERKVGARGRLPTLSREAVADTGVRLADADGLAALSMDRIAAELRVTPMALYRYVPGKAELVALMIDRGLGAPPELEGRSWRPRLVVWARAMFSVLRRHPWSLGATARLRIMGPNELSWLEAGMRVLASTGLSAADCHGACLALVGQIRTAAQFASSRRGLTPTRWTRATLALVEGRPDYTLLGASLRRGAKSRSLEESLAWALDGIAARIERRAREGARRRGAPGGPASFGPRRRTPRRKAELAAGRRRTGIRDGSP